MKVKGTVVASIDKFVKDNFPAKYKDWKLRLPDESKELFNNPVMATEWYDAKGGVLLPTKLIGEMFYDFNVKKAAWDAGNYSAKVALTGVYKVFILVSTPAFMMARAGKIMGSFYDQAVLTIAENRSKGITLHMTQFPEAHEIFDHRIGGWMERALIICGCKNIQSKIPKSLSKGDNVTEFIIDWE